MKDVIMFVDTGIDDAVAILLSAFDYRTRLKAIVACEGNSNVDDVVNKTLQVVEFLGKDIPVYRGIYGRIGNSKFSVSGVHGEQGNLGGFNFPPNKNSAKSFEEFIKMFNSLTKKVDILCVSPLSSLAKILMDNPNLKEKISHIYFQGGLLKNPDYVGFNVGFDPEAFQVVLDSGIKLVICPSDFGHEAFLSNDEIQKIKGLNRTGEMLEYIFRCYKDQDVGDKGVATHDGCASFLIRHHEYFWIRKAHVFLDFNQDGYGILKFDFKSKPKNAKVCVKMYAKKFKQFVFKLIKKAK